ncbi:MAG: aspartate/glutamate racemase family protein [Chlamydiales bacterium]|nr:aspartate/glutamate racemase family protein [Chlamydiales bacterium]
MKPKAIGIIGGAGPFAGLSLLERILILSRELYGCYRDSDFPKVFFINFPFSEMLSPAIDAKQIQNELRECLDILDNNGAGIMAIACNTLHAFLDNEETRYELILLPQLVIEELQSDDVPTVLCSSTSRKTDLHRRFFPCIYPDLQTQVTIDDLIDDILKGNEEHVIEKLLKVIERIPSTTIILGCTELSLFSKDLSSCNKRIIDPLDLLAIKILKKSFQNNRR